MTVVDAAGLMANFGSLQSLAQREPGRVDAEDDRNVADLLLDQIEFADVLLLNKVMRVSPPCALSVHQYNLHGLESIMTLLTRLLGHSQRGSTDACMSRDVEGLGSQAPRP